MDDFCEVTGYHRKAAIRLLRGSPPARDRPARRRGRPVRYGTRTVEVLVAIWTAAGLPWSARLKALRPAWRPWARPRVRLTPALEDELCRIRARQIDRRLQPHTRPLAKRLYGRTKPGTRLTHHISIRTEHWSVTTPGLTEIDLVSHSGDCQPSTLPEMLSREEVQRLIAATESHTQRALVVTAYATGLRVKELVHVTLTDLDAARGTIRVEQGKGATDRSTILSPRLLEELRAYWTRARPRMWRFPGRDGQRPLDTSGVGKAYTDAKRRAGITKRGGIHALRHAFATHVLDMGVDLPTIQRLLGHTSIQTTMRYLHVARSSLTLHGAPIERLSFPSSSPSTPV